ncbi:MAG: ATP synthase F1 subunit epsilon [Alphaproteobacteria bacterium]
MADKLNFELVSPERALASEACEMVIMPGEDGDLGILVEHAPMVVLLRSGVVAVHDGGSVTKRFFVAGGFAEVRADGCIVLTEEGLDLAAVTRDSAATRLDTAQRDLAEITEEGPVKDRAERSVKVAEALVEAVETA